MKNHRMRMTLHVVQLLKIACTPPNNKMNLLWLVTIIRLVKKSVALSRMDKQT